MKKIYILLITSLIINFANAQSYIKMIDTTNVWDVLCGGITTNGDDERQTDMLQFIGDTVINDTTYHKLFSYTHYTINDSSLEFIGCLREDTIQQQVFIRNSLGEEKIYDFSLNIGDSLVTNLVYGTIFGYDKLDSVKSIFFANKQRREFFFSFYYLTAGSFTVWSHLSWIEGIGYVDDFGRILGPIKYLPPFIDKLLCFWQSGQMLYQNPEYLSCEIIHVGIDKFKANESFNIYPNPVNNNLTIKTSQSIKKSILTIYSSTGQELIKRPVIEMETQLDLTNLTRGIYFVKLVTDKEVIVKKILKE